MKAQEASFMGIPVIAHPFMPDGQYSSPPITPWFLVSNRDFKTLLEVFRGRLDQAGWPTRDAPTAADA